MSESGDAFTKIAAGDSYNLALKPDGSVLAWGGLGYGYLHSLALKQDGTVVAWGNNDFGQCTTPAGLQGVLSIAAGAYNSIALFDLNRLTV